MYDWRWKPANEFAFKHLAGAALVSVDNDLVGHQAEYLQWREVLRNPPMLVGATLVSCGSYRLHSRYRGNMAAAWRPYDSAIVGLQGELTETT